MFLTNRRPPFFSRSTRRSVGSVWMLYSGNVRPSLKLLARERQPLLVRMNSCLVLLVLGLGVVDGARCLVT